MSMPRILPLVGVAIVGVIGINALSGAESLPGLVSGARAFAKDNITVNGFAPGVVNTPLWEQLDKDLMEIGASQRPGQAIAEFSAGILRGRAATPEDIAGSALFLASPESDYMTGQIIMIDGGMVLV